MDTLNTTLEIANKMETIKLLLAVTAIALITIGGLLALHFKNRRAEQQELNEQKVAEANARNEERKAQAERDRVMLDLYRSNVVALGKLTDVIDASTQIDVKRNAVDEEQTRTLAANTAALQGVVQRTDTSIVKIEAQTQAVTQLKTETIAAQEYAARKLEHIETISERIDKLPDQMKQLTEQITPMLKEMTEIADGIRSILESGKNQTEIAKKLNERFEGMEKQIFTFIEKVALPTALKVPDTDDTKASSIEGANILPVQTIPQGGI